MCQTTQWPKEQVQMDKQRYTIHYTENYRSSDTNPTKSYVIFRKGIIQFYNPQDVNGRTISDMRPTLIDFIKIKLIFFHLIYSRSRFKLSL
jgi:hypothetical protein